MSLGWSVLAKKPERGGQVQGVARDELLLPMLPWLTASWDPLECRRCMPVEEGAGRFWCAPRKESQCWILCLEAFISLAGRNLRGGHKGGFQQNVHQFPKCAPQGHSLC